MFVAMCEFQSDLKRINHSIYIQIPNRTFDWGFFFATMKTTMIQSITGGLVVIVALIFAGMLAVQDILPYLSGWKRIVTICILVLYATYRFSRIYKDFKLLKQNKD